MNECTEDMVQVTINNAHDIQHFEKLGYVLPKVYDKTHSKHVVRYGTTILVQQKDTQDHWLIGKQFGHLTVIEYDYKKSEQIHGQHRYRYWKCQCDCSSSIKSIRQKDLLDGSIVSCGKCSNNHSKLSKESLDKKKDNVARIAPRANSHVRENLIGNTFGRLTVIRQDLETPQKPTKDGYFRIRWWCKCSCGNPELKSVLAGHLKSGKIQSCGCLWKESISGENNWNWKGGATPEERLIRVQEDYTHWRYDVLKRDNFHCQCCGEYGTLNAHHIFSFSKHEDLRFNVDNGITLCEACHAISCEGSFHNVYGTHDNTPDQLREYILNKSGKDIYITNPKILTLNNTKLYHTPKGVA